MPANPAPITIASNWVGCLVVMAASSLVRTSGEAMSRLELGDVPSGGRLLVAQAPVEPGFFGGTELDDVRLEAVPDEPLRPRQRTSGRRRQPVGLGLQPPRVVERLALPGRRAHRVQRRRARGPQPVVLRGVEPPGRAGDGELLRRLPPVEQTQSSTSRMGSAGGASYSGKGRSTTPVRLSNLLLMASRQTWMVPSAAMA